MLPVPYFKGKIKHLDENRKGALIKGNRLAENIKDALVEAYKLSATKHSISEKPETLTQLLC